MNEEEAKLWFERFSGHLLFELGAQENTNAAYTNDLKHFYNYLSSINNFHLEELPDSVPSGYIRLLSDMGLSTRTIARHISSLKSFFRFLYEQKILISDPTERIMTPRISKRLPEALSFEEIETLIAAVPLGNHKGLRDRAFIEFLYASGARISEALDAKISDFYADISFVRLFGKGRKDRLVPIGSEAVYWLKRYIRDGRPKFNLNTKLQDSYIFLNRFGRRLSRMGAWKILRQYSDMVDLGDRVHPHVFRHSFATHLLEGGADLRSIQEMLGHTDISNTQIYTNISRKHILSQYQQYHPRSK